MSINVKLSTDLISQAKPYGEINNRSVPEQIEYWAKIGRTAEDNPDLPFDMIFGMLEGLKEVKEGLIREY